MTRTGDKHTQGITEDWGARLLPFPRRHRPGSRLPAELLANQRCIVCHTHGCVPRYVVPPYEGGEPTGDNLLPVCRDHAQASIVDLYQAYPAVRRWLLEHERIDVASRIEENLVARRNRGQNK